MFYRLIASLTNISLVLENFFVVLLKSFQALAVFFAESFETIVSFVDLFSFSILQLFFQFSKILLIFSPGILFILIGYYNSFTMLVIGSVYILLLIVVAFGFRTVATENGITNSNVPNTWLWYFPYSWFKAEFIKDKLSGILQLHNRLRDLSTEFNNNTPFKKDVMHIAKNSSFKLIVLRRNMFRIIRKIQQKHGMISNLNVFGCGILSKNEGYNTELRINIYEYLEKFETQFSTLVEDLETLHNKAKNFVQFKSNTDEKESFRREIENVGSLLKALDSINSEIV